MRSLSEANDGRGNALKHARAERGARAITTTTQKRAGIPTRDTDRRAMQPGIEVPKDARPPKATCQYCGRPLVPIAFSVSGGQVIFDWYCDCEAASCLGVARDFATALEGVGVSAIPAAGLCAVASAGVVNSVRSRRCQPDGMVWWS